MEVITIKLSIQSKQKDIIEFLLELKNILHSEEFNIDRDFTIIKSKKKSGKEQFSTPYTILDLEYDASDIIECLKELTVREYSETLVDKDDTNPLCRGEDDLSVCIMENQKEETIWKKAY